jgi:hypothetical protein
MAPLVHHFSPCTTYWPPPPLQQLLLLLPPPPPPLLLLLLRVIAEVMLVASLLATAFSVMAKQERMWPRSSGSSQVCCCSGVPYLQSKCNYTTQRSIGSQAVMQATALFKRHLMYHCRPQQAKDNPSCYPTPTSC